jgi:hypothetical protein
LGCARQTEKNGSVFLLLNTDSFSTSRDGGRNLVYFSFNPQMNFFFLQTQHYLASGLGIDLLKRASNHRADDVTWECGL